jgi:predicted nucleic acid-binding protein
MPYVLDASIAGCWCFHDEQDRRADTVFDLLETDHALVPLQWWFEIRDIVLVGERRKRISQQETRLFLERLERLTIIVTTLPNGMAVLEVARQYNLSFYDAAYLELAKREKLPLATLDRTLAEAARAEGIALI